jgi:uncharacterized membrane protein
LILEARAAMRPMGKGLFAALFVMAGLGHFAAPGFFLKIVPPYVPHPRAMVLVSGALEILLGLLLLIPRTSRTAAWGLIALLVAVFPANVFMYQHPEKFGLSPTLLLLRLPLQGLLILWAYTYARK